MINLRTWKLKHFIKNLKLHNIEVAAYKTNQEVGEKNPDSNERLCHDTNDMINQDDDEQ